MTLQTSNLKMNIKELKEQEMVALFSPEGDFQAMTLAPDLTACTSIIRTLHRKGVMESFHEMVKRRKFVILPIKVTIVQNGDENSVFQKKEETPENNDNSEGVQ